jgi:YVTN family beta-propeller protein
MQQSEFNRAPVEVARSTHTSGRAAPDAMNHGLRTRKATSHNLGISRLWARGFAAVWAALALTVVLSVGPAKAVPFAYITNYLANNVSVIDTATNMVVATVAVGDLPGGIAVTPDGSHVYVANSLPNSVSVIDTATNTVVASVGCSSARPELACDRTEY